MRSDSENAPFSARQSLDTRARLPVASQAQKGASPGRLSSQDVLPGKRTASVEELWKRWWKGSKIQSLKSVVRKGMD